MFPVFGAVILASTALVGAWFVHLSADAQAGRLRLAGKVLAGWLAVLAVLTVIGGAFAAGHHGHRGQPGLGPRSEAMHMHGGPGRFGRGPDGRGARIGPPPASQPATSAPAATPATPGA